MTTAVRNIIHSAVKKPDDDLKIVALVNNGQFEKMIANTGFTFYSSLKATKDAWDLYTFSKPHNYYLFDSESLTLPHHLTVDAILCHNKYTHYLNALQLSRVLHVPLILVEHTMPPASMRKEEVWQIARQSKPDLVIYPLQTIKNAWGVDGEVIPYGVELGTEREKDIDILIPGQFNRIDYPLIKEFIYQLRDYNVNIVGMNEGISKPAPSFEKYIELYARSKVVLSLNVGLNFPFEALYAAANRCAIVSNRTAVVEEWLNEDNCVLAKSVDTLIQSVKDLTKDSDRIKKLGDNARELAERHSMDKVIPLWHNAFKNITSKTYVRQNET